MTFDEIKKLTWPQLTSLLHEIGKMTKKEKKENKNITTDDTGIKTSYKQMLKMQEDVRERREKKHGIN